MGVSDPFFQSVELSGLTLRVADVDLVGSFYEETLGFERVTSPDGRVHLSPAPPSRPLLTLEPAPDAPARPDGAAGLYHVALLYPERAALGRVLARLVQAGIRLGAADHGVSEALYLTDPEGNGLELASDRPATLWPPPPADGRVAMFTEALDAQGLSEAGGTARGPLLPSGTRIGHVHLSVSSLDAAEAFYSRALGFPVRQRDYPGARFFGRDGYHHHLAANTWRTRAPATAGALGMAHFSVSLASRDAWRSAVESVREAGCLDRMEGPTAIARDPDGIEVRIGPMEGQ